MNKPIPSTDYSIPKMIRYALLDIGKKLTRFEVPYQRIRKAVEQWEYGQAIRRLQGQEHIELTKRGEKFFLKLTQKGKLQALLDKIKDCKTKSERWDEKWRVVIWDIPESSSKERDRIRYFLKKLGFYRLQLSVFIRPYPIPKEAVDYLKESGLIKFIRFLRVDKVDDHLKLLKHYNLQKRLHKYS